MFEVSVTTVISASHHLRGYQGKCEKVHGHNYKVEATVGTEIQDETGLALDFGVLKKHLNDVAGKFDHTDLNEHEEFRERNPSSENMAMIIYKGLQVALDDLPVKVIRVKVWETEGSNVTYHEGRG
jgi:6-pyruvoyltetrahydropterin/6-carboxytetrahydropterin synthase